MGGHRLSKYPILYKGDATDFFTLGLGPIQMLKATVTQERNGIFIFEGEILTDSPLFPLVLENYSIKADADHLLKDQRFRIKRIVPNHNGKAEIYAEHVSYLSRELTIKPEVSITGSAQTALSQWKASIVEPNPFVVDSDIPTSNKTKWRIDKVENPRMALGGTEGSVLDVWGGEYRFDNYHISLLQKRGTTAKTVLAYGRNITDFEQERNIANTYTSIMPYAIYTDDKENEIVVHIDGYVVDSEHINKYPNRVVQAVNFSSEFEHDEVPTKARLLALANHYIKANEIGVPSTSIKVSFVDLSKSPDYAEYAFLEQVNLCDDVRVYYPKLGVNTVAKVIRTVWNVLTESYDEIEIGQKRMSLVGQMQQQQQAIKEINTQTNYAMTSADGKNTIFYGLYGENGLGEPKAIKVGDTWYKPNGTGTDMLVWTGTIWKVLLDAETFNEINEKIDQVEKDIAQNIIDIESALDKATQAELDAGFSKDLAGEAKALGVTASSLAGEATTNAHKAMADAQEAIRQVELNGGVAADASAEATEARRLAGLAEGNAQEALTKANTSVTDASKALTDATKAFNKSFKSSAVAYTTSTNGNTPPTTGWASTHPTPSPDVYIWTRTTIVLNDNTSVVSYSVGKIGAKGDQGLKGDTGGQGIQGVPGVNAPTITSVVQQFYLSTSKSTQTGGSWLSTVPVWSSGKYYWVRVATTYSNGATTTSTPVLDNALNDSLVTALEVKTGNQNLSTTVTQHATLIEGKANSTTVDAIAGRVSTAEGSISTIAGQVALKASTTDVNTLTGRVTSAEGTITAQAGQIALRATTATVNALTGRVSAAESSLVVQSGKIDLAATKSELTTAIDGIEIGGRNLLRNQSKDWTQKNLSTGEHFFQEGSDYKVEVGQTYTFSIVVERVTTDTVPINLHLGLGSVAGNYTWDFNTARIQGVPFGKKISITFTVSPTDGASGTHIYFAWRLRNERLATSIKYKEVKLEKGNKATDWTPAPEDVDADISLVQSNLTVEAGKITALTTRVSGSETNISNVTQTVSGINTTISTLRTDVNGKATIVSLNAVKSTADGNKTTISNHDGRLTTVETNVSGLQTTVSNKADKSQITQLSTAIELRATKTDVTALTGRVTTAEGKITTQAGQIDLKANTTTVNTLTGRVATAEGNITTQAGQIALKANQTAVDTLTGRVTATEASIKVTDGKVTTLTTKTDGHTTSIGVLESSYSGLNSTVTQVKNNLEGMEIGGRNLILNSDFKNGLSYWGPWSGASLSINSAGNMEVYYGGSSNNNSGMSYLVDLPTSDYVITAKIKRSTEAITTKFQIGRLNDYEPTLPPVNTWGVITAFLKKTGGSFYIYRNNAGAIGTLEIEWIKVEKGNKATDWSPAPEDYATLIAFSALEQNLNGFKTTVANTYADKTTVTQLAGQWTTTTNLVNGHTSQIASLGTDLNLRATKADLISQINLSPETILIASKKIQIKGDTYIDNGVIKTAHIADLAVSGAKIANASIASAKIISLDVSKIVGNTTSFVQSYWNGISTTVSINANGLVSQSGAGLATSLNAGALTTTFGTKTGIADSNGYTISDTSNGKNTRLNSEGIEFGWYDNRRAIVQNSEGLEIRAYTGSDYRLNSALYLITGNDPNTSAYLHLLNAASKEEARVQMTGKVLQLRHPMGGHLTVADYSLNERAGRINAGVFRTSTVSGEYLEMVEKQIQTPRTGNHNIYIIPAGNGGVTIGGGGDGQKWPVTALRFIETSNRNSKVNIEVFAGSGLDVINDLVVTTYNRKDDLARGINRRDLGFIAEDSPKIASPQTDGLPGIDNYLTVSYLVKAVQELSTINTNTNKRINTTDSNVIKLVANDSIYGLRLNNLESEVFRLKKRIEELEKIA